MEDLNICIVSLVIIVFLLFIIRIISLSIRNIILLRQLKYEARLRARGSGNVCTPQNNSGSPDGAVPRCDNPPTYESAMANYMDAKQQLRAMEEGAVAGAMAMTASTTTIETCITDVESSRTDLRAPNLVESSPIGANTNSEAAKPPL